MHEKDILLEVHSILQAIDKLLITMCSVNIEVESFMVEDKLKYTKKILGAMIDDYQVELLDKRTQLKKAV